MSPAKRKSKAKKKKKLLPPPTTIGVNPLDTVVSSAAVLAAIRGLAAGERAEKKEAKATAKPKKRKR